MTIRVGIVGGSGYAGGELLRLLLWHPEVEITQVASGSRAGQPVHSTHPNLRKVTNLRYVHPDNLTSCDLLFLCLPHGESAQAIDRYRALAPRIIDLSADFRLRSPELYARWYGHAHPRPELLSEAVYGLPEWYREELRDATLVSGVGCSASATILGLAPLYKAGLIDLDRPAIIEAKFGSSAAGASSNPGSHHPDRSGAVRSFQPTGHRHSAEIIQEATRQTAGDFNQLVALSGTSIEMVRGILATAHVFTKEVIDEKAIWRAYRSAYGTEPFIRIVKERGGTYRYPEPKILAGSNFCDIGFEYDPAQQRIVVISALDNLMKGASGSAVQSMNVMYGFEETAGLGFPGLHPI